MTLNRLTLALASFLIFLSLSAVAQVADETRTPPRLSYLDGAVSFQRDGQGQWTPALLNTPLAAGDMLYATADSNLEIQVGPRAFIRAGNAETALTLVSLEPDYLRFKALSGQVSFDIRSMPTAFTLEIDTPQAVFTIQHPGYYRVNVTDGDTQFVTRRGGDAAVTPAGGQLMQVAPSEELVVRGGDGGEVAVYAAPDLDDWDRWNYDRTDRQIEAQSSRFVPPGVYGADALDQYGTWREVPTYGSVWIPQSVEPDWAPYTDGIWLSDPYYGWTWVDRAPWGWAPFHYGRWVFINGYWAWCPGPLVAQPIYSPALVAFFNFGLNMSWVALGWGEPLVPWWGRPGFIGHPWWGGWGGPHIVNNVVVNNTRSVNVNRIVYNNFTAPNAVRRLPSDQFGRTHERGASVPAPQLRDLSPVHGALPVKAAPVPRPSQMPGAGAQPREARPPEGLFAKPVVPGGASQQRPTTPRPGTVLSRPPLGTRNSMEDSRPPTPVPPYVPAPRQQPQRAQPQGGQPQLEQPQRPMTMPQQARPAQMARPQGNPLPGAPANRVYVRPESPRPAQAAPQRQPQMPQMERPQPAPRMERAPERAMPQPR
jgi:hypothetical protein